MPALGCQKGLDLIQHSQVGSLAGEAKKLSNQARFILEKCDGSLKVDPSKTSFFSTNRNAASPGGEQEETVDDRRTQSTWLRL